MDRWIRLLLWPIGLGTAVVGELGYVIHHFTPRETLPLDLSVSTVSIVVGLVLWRRRPDNNSGRLLVAAGMLWAIPGIRAFLNPVAFGIGEWVDGLQDIVFAHLLFAYPSGRLSSRRLRALVAAGYSLFVWRLIGVLVLDTRRCGCYPTRNAFQVWDDLALHDALGHLSDAIGMAVIVVGIGVLASRWWRASPAGRHVFTPVLAAGLFFAGAAGADLISLQVSGVDADWAFFTVLVARIVIPVAFGYGLLRGHLDRAAVGDLVVRIGGADGRTSLRDSLSAALRDPSLELVYWLPDRAGFVDRDGRPAALPGDRTRRAVTMIESDGVRLGAIVHDPAVLENPGLVRAATAVVSLALVNERLQAEVRAKLAEVLASRTRIVEAGDAERRRVERDLHDGAQQRLLALALSLQLASERAAAAPELRVLVDQPHAEARAAVAELRDLARGIHPAILTEAGLVAAVEDLAERAVLPVNVEASIDRLPPSVEVAAYFLVAEALANIAKHARAGRADIRIHAYAGSLSVEVCDDGVGGAAPAAGGGLSGLCDRIAALGGRLDIVSPPAGTRLHATIPLP